MRYPVLFVALAVPVSLAAQGLPATPSEPTANEPATPNEIVATAPASDWKRIAPEDLMVMDLAPDEAGRPRRVVIQLMPEPISQGWVANIRILAKAHWYDGNAVVRSQDNYVVQWGDPASDNETPDGKARGTPKPLPPGLIEVPEADYTTPLSAIKKGQTADTPSAPRGDWQVRDAYAPLVEFHKGWPLGSDGSDGTDARVWPVHCYGHVGVGRNVSPDPGSGAELYAVIGHAPRQLDRNIAVVGRIIEGIEHLSALPRGTGPLSFYETPGELVAIPTVRLGNEADGLPAYEYLDTSSASFATYVDKRANRKDEFYTRPAGGVDICNAPVPVRRVGSRP